MKEIWQAKLMPNTDAKTKRKQRVWTLVSCRNVNCRRIRNEARRRKGSTDGWTTVSCRKRVREIYYDFKCLLCTNEINIYTTRMATI